MNLISNAIEEIEKKSLIPGDSSVKNVIGEKLKEYAELVKENGNELNSFFELDNDQLILFMDTIRRGWDKKNIFYYISHLHMYFPSLFEYNSLTKIAIDYFMLHNDFEYPENISEVNEANKYLDNLKIEGNLNIKKVIGNVNAYDSEMACFDSKEMKEKLQYLRITPNDFKINLNSVEVLNPQALYTDIHKTSFILPVQYVDIINKTINEGVNSSLYLSTLMLQLLTKHSDESISRLEEKYKRILTENIISKLRIRIYGIRDKLLCCLKKVIKSKV